MKREIKLEWCENWIRATFSKMLPYGTGIERGCFFKMAEKAGLYIRDTYGSPMSQALENLCKVNTKHDADGNYLYTYFTLK